MAAQLSVRTTPCHFSRENFLLPTAGDVDVAGSQEERRLDQLAEVKLRGKPKVKDRYIRLVRSNTPQIPQVESFDEVSPIS